MRLPTIGTLFAASFFGHTPSPAMLTAFLHMVLGRDHEPLLPLLEAFTSEDLLARRDTKKLMAATGADEALLREVARPAIESAGLTPADIDVREIYDCYTYTAMITLEDYGFCGIGETKDFIDGMAYDGHKPNAYIDGFAIGLKGQQKVEGGNVTGK